MHIPETCDQHACEPFLQSAKSAGMRATDLGACRVLSCCRASTVESRQGHVRVSWPRFSQVPHDVCNTCGACITPTRYGEETGCRLHRAFLKYVRKLQTNRLPSCRRNRLLSRPCRGRLVQQRSPSQIIAAANWLPTHQSRFSLTTPVSTCFVDCIKWTISHYCASHQAQRSAPGHHPNPTQYTPGTREDLPQY